MSIKWIKIDPNNLPREFVLAKSEFDVLVGQVYQTLENTFYCKSINEVRLYNITHYILISELLKLESESHELH